MHRRVGRQLPRSTGLAVVQRRAQGGRSLLAEQAGGIAAEPRRHRRRRCRRARRRRQGHLAGPRHHGGVHASGIARRLGDHQGRGGHAGGDHATTGPAQPSVPSRRYRGRHRLLLDRQHHPRGKPLGGAHGDLATQAVAGEVIARPGLAQRVVVIEPAQQETQLLHRQLPVHAGRKIFAGVLVGLCLVHVGSSRPDSSGRSFSSIASRARKMRERTVPIGQPIASAISS